MQALLDEAADNGQSVTIHVEHNNPAMHLYQRLGFQHMRDEGVYYFMEWKAGAVRQGTDTIAGRSGKNRFITHTFVIRADRYNKQIQVTKRIIFDAINSADPELHRRVP